MYTYFMYSRDHVEEQESILGSNGKKFVPGSVTVGMSKKQYSRATSDPNTFRERYVDAVVVAQGEKKDFTYTEPSIERK